MSENDGKGTEADGETVYSVISESKLEPDTVADIGANIGANIGNVIASERQSLWLRRSRWSNRVEARAVAEEKARQKARDESVSGTPAALPDLFGICLSGGGIRSASFCLGALQALNTLKLVERADYLSTVSGGGYIGAGMVAAMTRDASSGFPYSASGDNDKGVSDIADNGAVSHLRDHSRYLIPHGISDVFMSLTVVARGLAVNLFLTLMVILPLATITVLANPTLDHLDHSLLLDIVGWGDHRRYLEYIPAFLLKFSLTKILGLSLLFYLVFWGLARSLQQRAVTSDKLADGKKWLTATDAGAGRGISFGWLLGLGFVCAAALELQGPVLLWIANTLREDSTSQTVMPSIFASLVAFLAATAGLRSQLSGWVQKGMANPAMSARLGSALSKAILWLAALVVPLLVYIAYLGISLWGIAASSDWPIPGAAPRVFYSFVFGPDPVASDRTMFFLVAAVAAMLAWWAYRIWRYDDSWQMLVLFWRRLRAVKGGGRKLAGLIAVVAFLGAGAFASRIGFVSDSPLPCVEYIVLFNYALATGLVILLGFRFTPNSNSLHGLYRDRLNAAFKLHFDKDAPPQSAEEDDGRGKPMRLQELSDQAPYLLINAALNARVAATTFHQEGEPGKNKSNSDPVKRGRKAEFFLFSKHYIGSDSTSYVPTGCMTRIDPQLNLAAATAISGAAFSSNMGRSNIDALSPSLALLNVRLGYWLDNPLYCRTAIRDLPTWLPWHDFFRAYLFAEAFGLLRTDSSKIYVTDGGHVDNLGLYALLRRRCDHIIVIDAEADPALHCGALVDVQRFARIDLGIRIDIDVTGMQMAAAKRAAPVKEGASGTAKGWHVDKDMPAHDCHFAVGKVLYPEDRFGPRKEGVLVYIKPVMTGDEPDYVLDYERRYPDFPQETTADQFFSEDQMEAYRALGFHTLGRAFSKSTKEDRSTAAPSTEEKAAETARQTIAAMMESLVVSQETL